jgi:hypothetical protein
MPYLYRAVPAGPLPAAHNGFLCQGAERLRVHGAQRVAVNLHELAIVDIEPLAQMFAKLGGHLRHRTIVARQQNLRTRIVE